ncbi:hypothetical protein EVJ33_00550 [Exiguobacterium sp. SL-10]|uniref:hypothetical protein n=1 Tax=Exiguobacterium sp. SL-10 TaxID=2510962 RepID=UPI00103CB186|nr:hypothetical protein [Exiguobacterium sp. SL-10]TCI31603.1 hypothetical protein EVJ33_00550 [Exiguobacterium sp. SL-10]
MIGYLILIVFWVLATLTVFALSIPYIRKRETKGVISLLVAVLSLGVYSLYVEGLERVWWAWALLAIGFSGGAAISTFIEQRDVEQEVPQRMVK